MDNLKKATMKDFTAWDLNCPYVHIYNKTEWKKKFIRKARRNAKRELKKNVMNFE
jgi:hypothetical protein